MPELFIPAKPAQATGNLELGSWRNRNRFKGLNVLQGTRNAGYIEGTRLLQTCINSAYAL